MWQIGAFSYSLSATSGVVFTLLLLTVWRRRLGGAVLVAAVSFSALWALSAAIDASHEGQISIVTIALELIKNLLWVLFLTRLIHVINTAQRDQLTLLRSLIWLGFAIPVMLFAALIFQGFNNESLDNWFANQLVQLGYVVLAIVQLVYVEHIFRNAPQSARWGLKFLCIGVALNVFYDFYLYSDSLLFAQVDADLWYTRGVVGAVTMALIAISIKRNPQLSSDTLVSRTVVFYSSALFLSGVYLVVIAAGGYYIKAFGGDWGEVARAAFLFFGVAALVVFGVSGQTRARLRVLIEKHFLNYRYDYREEWLNLIRQLSTPSQEGEQLEQRALKVVADMMDSPGGSLWLRGAQDKFRPMATMMLSFPSASPLPRDASLARFLETWQWVINLQEYQTDRQLYQDLELPDWLAGAENAWLVVPLMLQQRLHGFVILCRPRAKRKFDWEDIDILKTAGRQIAVHLAQTQSALALAEAQQFEAFNRMSAYVVHDLKNLVSQLALLVRNAQKHKTNPAFVDDMVLTVDNAVARMNRLLAQLRSDSNHAGSVASLDLDQVIRAVVQDKSNGKPIPHYDPQVAGLRITADRDRLVSVLGHLVQNAQDATPADGRVVIRLARDQRHALIEVEDNGAGMDESFVKNRLFRPFDSTKGLTGMGIGAHDAKVFFEALGGSISVNSAVGVGTTFRVLIPIADETAEAM